MKIEQRQDDAMTLLRLSGRLDLEGTQEIDQEFSLLASTASQPMIVDLRDVSFLASLGMRMFVTAAKSLRTRKLPFVLLAPQQTVRDALDVAGLGQLLVVADDETDAQRLAGEA